MFNTSSRIAKLLIPVALIGGTTGFVAGCGSGVDQSKLNEVKKQGQDLQAQGKKVQQDAQQIAADVKSGKISAEEGQKKLEGETNAIADKAKKTESTAIDAVKNANIPDSAKKQLQDAQDQLNASK